MFTFLGIGVLFFILSIFTDRFLFIFAFLGFFPFPDVSAPKSKVNEANYQEDDEKNQEERSEAKV